MNCEVGRVCGGQVPAESRMMRRGGADTRWRMWSVGASAVMRWKCVRANGEKRASCACKACGRRVVERCNPRGGGEGIGAATEQRAFACGVKEQF